VIGNHDIQIDALPRSQNCPMCSEVAFVVVEPPVLECLHCGSQWQFRAPPMADRDI
jgi:transcription elongation factor Elf1